MENIRQKSVEMSEFFIDLWQRELKDLGFELTSPEDSRQRGSHVSFSHIEAFRINKALMDRTIDGMRIVPDFRAPNILRFGLAPLYCTFGEIARTVAKLKNIVAQQLYSKYDFGQSDVT